MKRVTVVIPCHNEEAGIADVIKGFPRRQLKSHGYELKVLVVDNNSTDRTTEVARAAGAEVIHESKKGKGNAIRTGFHHISADTDYVVMLDGDDTYRPQEVLRLLELLSSGFSNVVIGSRLAGRISEGSMSDFNRLGNWVFSHLVRYTYRVNVTDVLTGYFAWTRQSIERLRPHLKSNGFAIEMEMITKMARLGEDIYSVPISYHSRAGDSNLRPIYDGSRILKMYLANLRWKPSDALAAPAAAKTARTKPAPKPPKAVPAAFHEFLDNDPSTAIPLRVAMVSDAIYPYHKGGKEKRLYEVTKRLAENGLDVHIYTMKWWDGPKSIKQGDVHLHAISHRYPLYTDGRRSVRQAVGFGLATFKLAKADFDVIEVDSMPFFPLFSARVVCWLRRKRLHATWHEVTSLADWQEYIGRIGGLVGWTIERLAMSTPDVIISNSDHTTDRLQSAGIKQPVVTVPLGVDLEQIYAIKPSADKSDVIFVGRLLDHKNVDQLIRAIAILKSSHPNIKCKVVGDGPEKPHLSRLITKLKLRDNVQLTGVIESHRDLYSLMKASRVFVLPSVREGFSLVAVEANAAGLPVITTDHRNNAARELIADGVNGYLCEPTATALAEQILRVLQPDSALQPGAHIADYDWDSVAARVKKILTV